MLTPLVIAVMYLVICLFSKGFMCGFVARMTTLTALTRWNSAFVATATVLRPRAFFLPVFLVASTPTFARYDNHNGDVMSHHCVAKS